MKLLLAQLNPTIGDLRGNAASIAQALHSTDALVITPELALTGYPPRDLLTRPDFMKQLMEETKALIAITTQTDAALLLGTVVAIDGDPLSVSRAYCNAALLIEDGHIIAIHRKQLLPTYDVFDEARYFAQGSSATVVAFRDQKIGITICEDLWGQQGDVRYTQSPIDQLAQEGVDLMINISASPFEIGKPEARAELLGDIAKKLDATVVYVNQVGGNDGLLFDGSSMVVSPQGEILLQLPAFESAIASYPPHGHNTPFLTPIGSVYSALCMGVRDFAHKCNLRTAIIGLSGGIDSALTACIAVDALGKDHVIGVTMPSRFSSPGSVDDSMLLARNLGMRCDMLRIEPMHAAFLKTLRAPFDAYPPDATEENLQARIRGTLLMAYANKLGGMVLNTGNKSEVAVGYCTLYGDMNGAISVISDLYKTDVYALARFVNRDVERIPQAIIDKTPSAELRPNQTDQDSLPPYDVLDAILRDLIEGGCDLASLLAKGHDAPTVHRIFRLVQRAEFKRRQMPPGLRISSKAFGEGWRMPIAAQQ